MQSPHKGRNWEVLLMIQRIIFGLNKENISKSILSIIDIFNENYSYSFNLVISQIIYTSFVDQINDIHNIFNFMKEFDTYQERRKITYKIFDVFSRFLKREFICEKNYLLNEMIKCGFTKPDFFYINIDSPYFAHISNKKIDLLYFTGKFDFFYDNYMKLKENDWELHKKYIEDGVNPNEIAKIIRNDEIEKLQEISSQPNFDFNQTIEPSLYERCSFINEEDVTLIDYSAFFSSVKCFKYLLMNGAKVENTGKYAIAGGYEEIIHLCEQNNSSFEGAYETAIEFHRNDIFKYIYENKIGKINNLEELGTVCVLNHNYEIFVFLEKEGMKINDSIIKESALIGNIFLLKSFLNKNQIPNGMLVFSTISGNIELVEYILKQEDIDINEKDEDERTSLINASYNGDLKIVKLLLGQKGIDINAKDKNGNRAFIEASYNGHTEIMKILLKQEGIDINEKNKNGETPLFCASQNGYIEAVKLLLEQEGIDINAKDNWEWTALIWASYNGHTEIVKLLLEQEGIDINAKNKDGTALIEASSNGHIEIVKLLLEQEGIDINAQDNDGYTALMFASLNGHIEIVKLLLEQEGIDFNAKSKDGWTALILASDNGYPEIVDLLYTEKKKKKKKK